MSSAKILKITFLMLIILAGIGIRAFAEIPDPLRVAVIPDLAPISFLDENRQPDGIFPRVVREIARTNGLTVEWSIGTWNESLEKAKQGDVDLMIGLIYTQERDEYLDFNSESVISSWSQVFQSRIGNAETIHDLDGKRVGMVLGDQNARGFVELAESFNISYQSVVFGSFDEIYDALMAEDIDAGVFYSLYHRTHPDLVPTTIIFQPNRSYFAVPEGSDKEILSLIDRTLIRWKDNENSFYFREVEPLVYPESQGLPQFLKILIPTLAGLAVFGGILAWFLRRQVLQRNRDLTIAQNAYRDTFKEAHIGVSHCAVTAQFIRANRWLCEYLDYTEAEILGKTFIDITHPEDISSEEGLFEEILANKRDTYSLDKRLITAAGTVKWVHLTVSAIRGTDGEFLYTVGLTEDITARKDAEERLGDLERMYQGVFDNSYQIIALFDERGRLLDANTTLKKQFNLPMDLGTYIGLTPSDLEWLGTVGSLRVQEMVDECQSTGRTIRYLMDNAESGIDLALDVTVKPILGESSSVRFCVVEAHDVTELKKLTQDLENQVEERTKEIRQAQKSLIESEKMVALGRMVSGIAHEINTPVGVSKTGISFVQEQLKDLQNVLGTGDPNAADFEPVVDALQETSAIIETNLGKAIKLIQDFTMTAADQSSREIRKVSVKEYLEAVMHSVRPQLIQAGIGYEVEAPTEECSLHVGPMNQILTHFATNSLHHAFPEGRKGKLKISYRCENNQRILTYSDNGIGIPEDLGRRIYEPFFTTGRGKGLTGLGLTVVYNVVTEILKGEIHQRNLPAGGSEFLIQYSVKD